MNSAADLPGSSGPPRRPLAIVCLLAGSLLAAMLAHRLGLASRPIVVFPVLLSGLFGAGLSWLMRTLAWPAQWRRMLAALGCGCIFLGGQHAMAFWDWRASTSQAPRGTPGQQSQADLAKAISVFPELQTQPTLQGFLKASTQRGLELPWGRISGRQVWLWWLFDGALQILSVLATVWYLGRPQTNHEKHQRI